MLKLRKEQKDQFGFILALVCLLIAVSLSSTITFAGGGTWTGPGAGKGDKVFSRLLLESKRDPYDLFREVLDKPGAERRVNPDGSFFDKTLQSDRVFLEGRVPKFAEGMFEAFNGSTDWYVMDINSDAFKATEAGKRILAEQRRILSERGIEAAPDNDIEFYALQDEDGIIIDSRWLARVMAKPEAERKQLLSDMARHEALRFKKIREDMRARPVQTIPPANAHCYHRQGDGTVRKVVTEASLAQIEGLISEKSLDAERFKDRLTLACFSPTKSKFELDVEIAQARQKVDHALLQNVEAICTLSEFNETSKSILAHVASYFSHFAVHSYEDLVVTADTLRILGLLSNESVTRLKGVDPSRAGYGNMSGALWEEGKRQDLNLVTRERVCGAIPAAREFLGIVRGEAGIPAPDSLESRLAGNCQVQLGLSNTEFANTVEMSEKWKRLIERKGNAIRTLMLSDSDYRNFLADRDRAFEKYYTEGFEHIIKSAGYDPIKFSNDLGLQATAITCAEIQIEFGDHVENCSDSYNDGINEHRFVKIPRVSFKDSYYKGSRLSQDKFLGMWPVYDPVRGRVFEGGGMGLPIVASLNKCVELGYLNPVPTGLQPAAGQLSDREGAKSPLDVILGPGSVVDPYADPAKIAPAD